MRTRTLIAVSAVLSAGCSDPVAPGPWITGDWLLSDSLVFEYTVSEFFGAPDTVTFSWGQFRDLAVRITAADGDSIRFVGNGRLDGYYGYSNQGPLTTYVDSAFVFDATFRVNASYIYGQYLSDPDDSLPLPSGATTVIDWNADSAAACDQIRLLEADPGNHIIPGTFSCRQRIHWRRP